MARGRWTTRVANMFLPFREERAHVDLDSDVFKSYRPDSGRKRDWRAEPPSDDCGCGLDPRAVEESCKTNESNVHEHRILVT